ncbi:WD40-repeat-containing domain protein, partial [Pelagophyceae sp. CCMP2097]
VTAVAVTAASDRVLTGADDCCGRIWSAETRQLLHALALRGHSDTVNDVVLDAENLTAFSASRDTSVRVWDLRCGRCRFNLTQHFGSVQCLASDSTLDHGRGGFISGARDTTVHVWARQSGALVQALRSQRGFIAALQLLPRNFAGAPPLLAAASTNGKIRLWDHHSGKLVRNYAGLQQAATCLAYHSMVHGPDAGWLFAGGADCAVRVWDARTAHATATIDGHLGAITGLHAHPLHGGSRSARIFSASRDGSVRVCDI